MQNVKRNGAMQQQHRPNEEAPAPTSTTVPLEARPVRWKHSHTSISAGSFKQAKPATEKLNHANEQEAKAAGTETKKTEQRLGDAASSLRGLCGTRTDEIGGRIVKQVACALVWPELKTTNEIVVKSLAAIAEMAPKNATEAMLAAQMMACHEAGLMFLNRATAGQYQDAIDANVLRATRLMRVFAEQLEALQKLRGKAGQQKVTVEHVHVHEGGQAIVGSVNARRDTPIEGGGNGGN
jgi:hypothetical protein